MRYLNLKERICINLAWLLPREVAYWVFVRVFSEATVTRFRDRQPDEVSWREALESWQARS